MSRCSATSSTIDRMGIPRWMGSIFVFTGCRTNKTLKCSNQDP
ncbi:unnamed protein product, partial [Cyprideis torosa]